MAGSRGRHGSGGVCVCVGGGCLPTLLLQLLLLVLLLVLLVLQALSQQCTSLLHSLEQFLFQFRQWWVLCRWGAHCLSVRVAMHLINTTAGLIAQQQSAYEGCANATAQVHTHRSPPHSMVAHLVCIAGLQEPAIVHIKLWQAGRHCRDCVVHKEQHHTLLLLLLLAAATTTLWLLLLLLLLLAVAVCSCRALGWWGRQNARRPPLPARDCCVFVSGAARARSKSRWGGGKGKEEGVFKQGCAEPARGGAHAYTHGSSSSA